MPDDLTKKGPRDASKINVNEDWELDYWTKELGVPAETLKGIVSLVGTRVSDVKRWMGKA